jgi:hypothetical protein
LNPYLAFGCDYAAGRHPRAKISAFLNGDFASAHVDQYSPEKNDQNHQRDESDYNIRDEGWKTILVHD